jgi:hypothetical protein
MIGRLKESIPLSGGEWLVSFTTRDNPGQIFDDLKGEAVKVEIKKASKAKSRDANAYCWVLIDKLAEKLGESKEAVYRQYITNIGGNSEVVCVKNNAVERLCSGWSRNGIGWQTDTFESKIQGCTNVILYYGSSAYDTAQMARLLDLIIQDCKEFGIPTETPNEIARLKALWGE